MPDSPCLSNTPTSNDRARRTEPFARCPGASRYRCRRLAQGKRRSDGHCLPTGRGRAALHSAYGPPPLRTHGLARPPDAPKLLSDLQLVHAPCSLLRPLVYRQPELMVAYLQEPNVPSDPASPPQPSVGDRSWGSRRRNHGSTPAQVDRRPPTHGFRTSRPSTWRRPSSPLRQRWPRLRSAGTDPAPFFFDPHAAQLRGTGAILRGVAALWRAPTEPICRSGARSDGRSR